MNKKLVIKFIALVVTILVVIFAWLFISSWNYQKNIPKQTPSTVNTPAARDAANYDEPFMRPIEVKFLDREELTKMGLGSDPMVRLQVLERDSKGNVTAYKKVYKDEDIVKYVFDPNGANATTTVSTTKTK